jgi:hypothetical protein
VLIIDASKSVSSGAQVCRDPRLDFVTAYSRARKPPSCPGGFVVSRLRSGVARRSIIQSASDFEHPFASNLYCRKQISEPGL